jgi:hypothetical protein
VFLERQLAISAGIVIVIIIVVARKQNDTRRFKSIHAKALSTNAAGNPE